MILLFAPTMLTYSDLSWTSNPWGRNGLGHRRTFVKVVLLGWEARILLFFKSETLIFPASVTNRSIKNVLCSVGICSNQQLLTVQLDWSVKCVPDPILFIQNINHFFWLVVDLPLWKIMEFVSWDYYSHYIWKNKSPCSKPPTSLPCWQNSAGKLSDALFGASKPPACALLANKAHHIQNSGWVKQCLSNVGTKCPDPVTQFVAADKPPRSLIPV